jgi:hypothetical protein
MTMDRVKRISFPDLVLLLKEKPLVQAAKAALQRIHMQATFIHGAPPNTLLRSESINVKVVLAGYMIAVRPTFVLHTMGELEQKLFESATILLSRFHQITDAILLPEHQGINFAKKVPTEASDKFRSELFDYLKCFKAWKVPDEARLSHEMRQSIFRMNRQRLLVGVHRPEVIAEFVVQIANLRAKYIQINGEEMMEQFDEDVRTGRFVFVADERDDATTLTVHMTNEELAHAVLLDTTFQLADDGFGLSHGIVNTYRGIRNAHHAAFWDAMEADLNGDPPNYGRVLRLLEEVREGITVLNVTSNINEIIDVEFITQRTLIGAFNFEDGVNLVMGTTKIIMGMQPDMRKEETADMFEQVKTLMETANADTQVVALVRGLEFLLNRVNILRVEAANARIRLIAPVVALHGISYEAGKFRDKVMVQKTIVPALTMRWISGFQMALAPIGSGVLPSAMRLDIHARAMVSLISGKESDVVVIPETLAHDTERIKSFKKEFTFLLKAKTLLTILGLPRLPSAAPPKTVAALVIEKTQTKERVSNATMALERMVEGEVLDMDKLVVAQDFQGMVENEIKSETDGPVRAILRVRLQTQIRYRLLNGNEGTAQLYFPNTLGMEGISPLCRRMEEMLARFRKITTINRDVHCALYDNIMNHVTVHGADGDINAVIHQTYG